MSNILTLNKISKIGLSKFTSDYKISDNIENPDAIILRSFNMHDYEMPASLLAIGRAGQNARLAAKLVGAKIDIKPMSWTGEDAEVLVTEEDDLDEAVAYVNEVEEVNEVEALNEAEAVNEVEADE